MRPSIAACSRRASSARELGRALLAEGAPGPRGSPRCATTARGPAPRSAAGPRARSPGPARSSHLVSPRATVGPAASWSTSLGHGRSSSVGGDGAVHEAPLGGLGARRAGGPSSSSSRARATPTRRGSSQVAPLSGVKPRSVNGSQNVASVAATVKSAASASWKPMPAAQPCTRHTTGVCTSSISGISRWASDGHPALDAADPGPAPACRRGWWRCGPRCRRRRRSGRRRRSAR